MLLKIFLLLSAEYKLLFYPEDESSVLPKRQ